MTRKTKHFNPQEGWDWEGCIEYADGSFDSIWSNPYEGEDEVMFTTATADEIAMHKHAERISEQDSIPAGLVTQRIVFGDPADWPVGQGND